MSAAATALKSVVLVRRPRRSGECWRDARSWLGGAPRLGSAAWPRGEDGQPLHFMAQIDLADVARAQHVPGLPASGSLAFFTGKVVYVPAAASRVGTRVPHDLPPLSASGGDPYYPGNLQGEQLFPFWPVEFTPIEATYDEDTGEDDERDQIARALGLAPRPYHLSAKQAFSGPPVPNWWQNAIHFANFLADKQTKIPKVLQGLQTSLEWAQGQLDAARSKGPAEIRKAQSYVELCQSKVASSAGLRAEFERFVAEVAAWVQRRDPWEVMSEADCATLEGLWASNTKFPHFTDYSGNPGVAHLKDKMFAALPGEGQPGFAELPRHVRLLIAERRAPRPLWWHTAVLLARLIAVHAERDLPQTRARLEAVLATERTKFARLAPGGALAPLWSMVGVKSKSKDVAELEARIAEHAATLAKHDETAADLARIARRAADWARGKDPGSLMAPAERSATETLFAEAKAKAKYALPYSLESLETLTLIDLAAAEDRVFGSLPASIRATIDGEARLPAGPPHKLFGRPVAIQDSAASRFDEGDILLLQLSYDDLMHWSFGDSGAYTFFISPADLARGNWDGVEMVFECH